MRAALAQLAEQDPLINVRARSPANWLSRSTARCRRKSSQATLAADYGIAVSFHETTPLYIERPARAGEAEEVLNTPDNPFHATIGLRVEPAAAGIAFRLDVDYQSVPLYVYRNLDEFAVAMEQYVRDALQEGLYGWSVTDCVVTMFNSSYSVADGPPSRRGPTSTAADFRKLTPLVLMQALHNAGTQVCEPISRVRVDAPASSIGAILGALAAAPRGGSRAGRTRCGRHDRGRPAGRGRAGAATHTAGASPTATVYWNPTSPATDRCAANRRPDRERPRTR